VLLVLSVVEAAILWFMPENGDDEAWRPSHLCGHACTSRALPAPRSWPSRRSTSPHGPWRVLLFSHALGRPRGDRYDASHRRGPGRGDADPLGRRGRGGVAQSFVPEKMFILGIVTLALGVLITLAGVQYQNVGVMLFGTLVGGIGFGTVFSGTLRSVLPYAQPGETRWPAVRLFRRGLSFLQAFPRLRQASSHPSLVLTRTADFYGIGVILLAITSLAVHARQGEPLVEEDKANSLILSSTFLMLA